MGDHRRLGAGAGLTPRPCASGCVQSGHDGCGPTADCPCACHNGPSAFRPPCDMTGGCGPHAPDPDCRGCRPRPAVRGVLCDRCDSRLTSALDVAADTVVHLRACLDPGAGLVRGADAGSIARPKRKFAPPAPVNLTAIDHADLIYALLVAAVEMAADALGLVGLGQDAQSWRAGTNAYAEAGARVGQVAGLRPGSDGRTAWGYAHWLTVHLDMIVAHEWAADLVSDRDLPRDCVSLATAVHRAAGGFPTVEKPVLITSTWLQRDARCPRCELRSLHRTPPDQPGAPVLVTCISPSCGWTGTDEDLTPPDPAPPIPSPRRAP